MGFQKATRTNLFARVAIEGPPGAGKSVTGLMLALMLAEGGPVAGIDTEGGSMRKYLGEEFHGIRFPGVLDIDTLVDFSPQRYTAAIQAAAAMGFKAVLVDSLSHAWSGAGGALELVDRIGAKQKGGNFSAWREVTPMHNELVNAILNTPIHIICTMRMKVEHVAERDSSGRMAIKKLGMKPVQREGVEYEFDLVTDMESETNRIEVAKTRCRAMFGKSAVQPGPEFFVPFIQWLKGGSMSPPPAMMNTGWTPQPDDAQQYDLAGPCTLGQQEAIASLAEGLKMGPDDLRAVLAKRGVSRRAELTYQQADDLIRGMDALLAQEEGVPF